MNNSNCVSTIDINIKLSDFIKVKTLIWSKASLASNLIPLFSRKVDYLFYKNLTKSLAIEATSLCGNKKGKFIIINTIN